MLPHLSQDIHEQIAIWHNDQNLSPEDIAKLAGCSICTVYYILSYHRDFGVVNNLFAKSRGCSHSLDTGDMNYLISLVESQPKIYLDELQEALATNWDIDVSLATISCSLRQWALSHKHVASEALERNEFLRAIWQGEYGDILAEYCVWLDEAGVDDRTNQQWSGWARVGQACVCQETFIHGQRYSVLPALTLEGIIALDIFEGSVNKERFLKFIQEQVAPLLNPYPGPCSVVILDNCAIHHDEDIRQIIEGECSQYISFTLCSLVTELYNKEKPNSSTFHCTPQILI
jgi:transposase